MTEYVFFEFPNGETWRMPARIPAEQRAEYYAEVDHPDDPEAREEVKQKEIDYALSDEFELFDWVRNNMNWEGDIKPHAERVKPPQSVEDKSQFYNDADLSLRTIAEDGVMAAATPAEEDYRAIMSTADELTDDDLADALRYFAMSSGGRHDAFPGTPDVGDIHAASVLDEGGEAVVVVKGTDGSVRIHVPEDMVEPFRLTIDETGRVYVDEPTDDTLIG